MNSRNLLALIDERLKAVGLKQTPAAKLAGKPDVIRNLRRAVAEGREYKIGNDTLEALAPVLKTSLMTLLEATNIMYGQAPDSLDAGQTQSVNDAMPPNSRIDLPIYRKGAAGKNGAFTIMSDVTDYAPRPSALERVPDAYALYVDGDSMDDGSSKSLSAGDVVVINPGQSPRRGDFIVLKLHGDNDLPGPAYIRRYDRTEDDRLIVSQLNPPREFVFHIEQVEAMHTITDLQRKL